MGVKITIQSIMFMKKRRVRAVILLSLIISAAALSSCGLVVINSPDTPETTAAVTEAVTRSDGSIITAPETLAPGVPVETTDNEKLANRYLTSLTRKDLDGVGITIATLNEARIIPTDSELPESEAKLLRNRAVEQKYNTILMTAESESVETLLEGIETAAAAGMYYADLLDIPSNTLGIFKAANVLMNLNSLPFTDYSADYYNSDAMTQTSGGYAVYGAVGQFNVEIQSMYCVFFNRRIAEEQGFESFYMLVEDGKWTWDIFNAFSVAVNDDVNDGFAFAGGNDALINLIYATTGNHYFKAETGIIPAPNFNNSATDKAVSTMKRLLYTDGGLSADTGTDAAMTDFYNGNLLFYINRLYSASWFINMSDDWGILPLPKLIESQDYYACTDDSATLLAVLSNSADIENIGLIMQALNAASYKYISDAYYSYLLADVLRDNNSLNMLDYLTLNIRYDFAFMFGSAYNAVPDASYKLLYNAVQKDMKISDYYTSAASKAATQLEKAFRMP